MTEHEDSIHISKLEVIEMIHTRKIVKMLDVLVEKLKKEDFSKDYLGGVRHARDTIVEMEI